MVCPASQARTLGLSEEYASAAQTAAKPSRSACRVSASTSAGSARPLR